MSEKTRAVRHYYDQNTRLFLSLGSSPETQSIHRAVWGEGVTSLGQALNYTNGLILEELHQLSQHLAPERVRIADLGCGVGGSLFYLLEHLDTPVLGVGLTISPVQARIARKRLSQKESSHPYHFLEADFQAIPFAPGMEVVYSVEAFVHATDPRGYFEGVSRVLNTGGRLILCDDFLSQAALPGQVAESWLEAYRSGWQVNSLHTLEEVEKLARAHQLALVRCEDLTPYLRLRALPDRLARLLLRVGRALPIKHAILPSMLGSMALQQCLHMGIIQYGFLVFEKQA